MATLGVNIDHVATVRQARRTDEPDPVWAAVEAQLGGASCITAHLREDRRHITDRDLEPLKAVVRVKFNLEMSIAPSIVAIAARLRPTQCCLVPERRQELTTEGGLDVVRLRRRVAAVVKKLKACGIRVSAFIEPLAEQVETAAEIGCDCVELWTGGYAHARTPQRRVAALHALGDAIAVGRACGLEIHGGHGLTYRNIAPVAAMPGFVEFNIGHTIVARAMFVGIRRATREMVKLLKRYAPSESCQCSRVASSH
ncbi:MAG: pyridoxine 5'-phosphate synthase [Phycisphaerae bacterium]|nr:pyridoxine 5'-phosphate synthase [Phycisphaerae bacterium]